MQRFAGTIRTISAPLAKTRHTLSTTIAQSRLMASCTFTPGNSKRSGAVTSASSARTALDETSKNGEFKRTEAGFRNHVKPGTTFAPEANRYVLYISYACPWANRCLAVLLLKGLRDKGTVTIIKAGTQDNLCTPQSMSSSRTPPGNAPVLTIPTTTTPAGQSLTPTDHP